MTNHNLLFIIVTILVTNNFLFCKLASKLVIIVTNNFWSLKLVTNKVFSCSGGSNMIVILTKILDYKEFDKLHLI